MTFYGENIGETATLLQIEVYVSEKGLFCDPKSCFEYWEAKHWKTGKGLPVKTLEGAINAYNGVVVDKTVKKEGRVVAEKKKQKCAANSKWNKNYIPYSKQLRDPRWIAYRDFILTIRGHRCEVCGATNDLQVHHLLYRKNFLAWEYSCKDVVVLCKKCHSKEHNIE
jgi:5-methylcytosine-specific restriction endonuclease McrA